VPLPIVHQEKKTAKALARKTWRPAGEERKRLDPPLEFRRFSTSDGHAQELPTRLAFVYGKFRVVVTNTLRYRFLTCEQYVMNLTTSSKRSTGIFITRHD
jgi:hypothetical protein